MKKIKVLVLDYFTGEVTEVTVDYDVIQENYEGDIEDYLIDNSDCYHNSCEWFVPKLDEDSDIIFNHEDIS